MDGGHSQRYVDQDAGFFLQEGVVVGSTNLGRKHRQVVSPKSANSMMLIDRNFINKKLPNSHNNTKYKEKNWLNNEIGQLDQLADWNIKNTKPIERKQYVPEPEDNLNINNNDVSNNEIKMGDKKRK